MKPSMGLNNMQKMKIKRIAKTGFGVFGVFLDEYGFPFCLTAERPDFNNEAGRSCIPAGVYQCEKVNSPKFGHCVSIKDVPNRTYILIHKGNVPLKDSTGCILVGEQFEPLSGQMAVLSSRHAFDEMMRLADNEFELTIKECV